MAVITLLQPAVITAVITNGCYYVILPRYDVYVYINVTFCQSHVNFDIVVNMALM